EWSSGEAIYDPIRFFQDFFPCIAVVVIGLRLVVTREFLRGILVPRGQFCRGYLVHEALTHNHFPRVRDLLRLCREICRKSDDVHFIDFRDAAANEHDFTTVNPRSRANWSYSF